MKNFSHFALASLAPYRDGDFKTFLFFFSSFCIFSLISLMKKSDEEQWSLKHKLISFEVERKSFEREKEFLRDQIASEQQKLQVI
jgi:hypothetical protein